MIKKFINKCLTIIKCVVFSSYYKNILVYFSVAFYGSLVYAADVSGIAGVDDMITSGQNLLMVSAKWGGVTTVVGSAIALGRGRLEGSLAQAICKILIVVGLLIAAFGFFKEKLAFGFAF